jgi:signal transduction histidine kinase
MHTHDVELAALAAHLSHRRSALLAAWRDAVIADPTLTTGASLPRAQLHDHIPALLADFERALTPGVPLSGPEEDAAAHGLHRWQQGFDLAEVARELGRLNECVVEELERYARAHDDLAPDVMASARRIWARQYGACVGASTVQYFRLQQIEAGGHIQDLEQALESLRDLEQQRAELWQQAAHDLRGNLGIVVNATAGLASPRASELGRAQFMRLLERNVRALHDLLNDVTSLARLQGGQEHRTVDTLDVAGLLHDLCERLQSQAQERGLYLRTGGPASLVLQADAVKLRRIAQNLVLNAVKYTRQGGVTVSWGETDGQDDARWVLQVQDTGPGFHAGPGAELAGALGAATDQSRQVDSDHDTGAVTHAAAEPATGPSSATGDTRAVRQAAGEGLGLSIVKRLCELLDATVELASQPNVGTTFRILLPRRYGE